MKCRQIHRGCNSHVKSSNLIHLNRARRLSDSPEKHSNTLARHNLIAEAEGKQWLWKATRAYEIYKLWMLHSKKSLVKIIIALVFWIIKRSSIRNNSSHSITREPMHRQTQAHNPFELSASVLYSKSELLVSSSPQARHATSMYAWRKDDRDSGLLSEYPQHLKHGATIEILVKRILRAKMHENDPSSPRSQHEW